MERDPHSDADLKKIYLLKNIAVVGMSKNEEKQGHFVPKYLFVWLEQGYNVIPVNPKVTEVLGRRSYPSIADIEEKIDIVDIFRKSEDIPAVTNDIINRKKE
ncbi:MAG: CoA-binding protein [Candidatus Nitrosopolaris sp.]